MITVKRAAWAALFAFVKNYVDKYNFYVTMHSELLHNFAHS